MNYFNIKMFLILSILISSLSFQSYAGQEGVNGVSSNKEVTGFKLKVAIGRFSNETNYGIALLRDNELDPLGKQAADILTAYLGQANKFLIFERPDLNKIKKEQAISGKNAETNIVGVDTLIVGSVVEFGRTTDGQRGLFNKKKIQKAHAKVVIRLVDVNTGLVFHTATGSGEATTTTKTVLGMGSTSRFDATLNDKAISIAIEDLIEELVTKLSGRTWKTDILQADGKTIYISGGKSQGLMAGNILAIMKKGKVIKSSQTGFNITLPSLKLGTVKVLSTFGETEVTEGSVTEIISGSIGTENINGLYITVNNEG